MTERLLVIDDDGELCSMLGEFLGQHGFAIDFERDGNQGIATALTGAYDLLILDVMLPGVEGFEALRRLREHSQIPVIMLTARGDRGDLDLPPLLTQPVKTQNPFKGELSHGVVA